MAEGYHGLLAPWIGGAGNDPTATAVGYRGLLSFWSGGVANSGVAQPGYQGLLAFWAGGAANSGTAPATMPHRRPSGVFLFGHMGLRDPRY